jgi:cell division septum initiation protein DivIVA
MSEPPQTYEEWAATAALPPEIDKDQLPRALFGYERSTIVELLNTMGERIRGLTQERADLERKVGELAHDLERSREQQRLIGETLVKARQEADGIRQEARRVADQDLRSAREQAQRIVEEAEQDAAAKADALMADAVRERRQVLEEAARARAFVDETHEQLSEFLLAAVRWYEQAKPAADGEGQVPGAAPASVANDRSSIPPSLTAALTLESQSTSSSSGRSDE